MARTEGTQDIPSELYDDYRGAITPQMPGGAVRKRYPWHIPKLQDNKYGTSAAQRAHRTVFRKCVDCFNAAPATGGVEPPAIGPRSREWWYDDAAGSGLWYYDYFIQQTLTEYLSGTTPDWCKSSPAPTRCVASLPESFCWWGSDVMKAGIVPSVGLVNWWLVVNPTPKLRTFCVRLSGASPAGAKTWTLGIYATPPYDIATVEWDTLPEPHTLITDWTFTFSEEWKEIEIPGESIYHVIKRLDGPETAEGTSTIAAETCFSYMPAFRPYFKP